METDEQLKREIEKWSTKLKKQIKDMQADNDYFTKNIAAYMQDSAYFKEKKDFVRSFEAIVWAWAFYNIGKELGEIR